MIWKRLLQRRKSDHELDEEIRTHFRMAAEDRMGSGENPREAERRARREFGAVAFALSALALASLGIYGVISFTVARRTAEMGIRIALGARGAQLVGMVVRQGMIPVAAGLAAGVLCSLAVSRLIASQLYGVAPNDPLSIAVVVMLLLAVALGACWIPARRATRVDPLTALRFE